MDLKDIKAIIDLMKKNSIAEFEMEKQDFKIKLKRQTGNAAPNSRNPPSRHICHLPGRWACRRYCRLPPARRQPASWRSNPP